MNPPTDIHTWLAEHDLSDLVPHFEANAITPDLLLTLNAEELREMGITALGHRKKLLAAIEAMKAPVVTAAPKPAVAAKIPVPSAVAPKPPPAPTAPSDLSDLSDQTAPTDSPKSKRKAWSAGFLGVSIALHLVFGLGAGYWVVQQIQAKRKLQFSGGPPTVSASKRALEHKVSLQKKKNAGGAPAQARRIAVTGLAASITLPEMPSMPNSSTQIVAGRMSGMGGAGFGTGMGFGNGSGMGVGGMGKGGLGLTMFGARNGGGLRGTFYDLKQTSKKEPSGVTAQTYNGIVRSWVAGGLKESFIDKYFQAPEKLYATQFMLPQMDATEAPKAYGVEKDVKPAQWVAHYNGKVSPPTSGTYQFVGTADDTLVVNFNGKLVLDGSWFPVSALQPTGIEPRGNYGGHPRKGYVKGTPFKATAGQWYDIDVVIGEQPGGKFFACLCVMEAGKTAMPLFRLSAGKLPKSNDPPPFDENGPIWKAISSSTSMSPLDMLKRSTP
ncbi:MAG: PA14 domain-containing protein [Prosthecobacter sp.]|uniref:PA14 domain-containing protein n=1 Tax=Prosthecobacter sp. TaxID=1965333 RepID=UPI0038FD7B0B